MISTKTKEKALFCDQNCEATFLNDIKRGAIYTIVYSPIGKYSPERWSLFSGSCACCGSPVQAPQPIPPNKPLNKPMNKTPKKLRLWL
jgi:hypothetical protein